MPSDAESTQPQSSSTPTSTGPQKAGPKRKRSLNTSGETDTQETELLNKVIINIKMNVVLRNALPISFQVKGYR